MVLLFAGSYDSVMVPTGLMTLPTTDAWMGSDFITDSPSLLTTLVEIILKFDPLSIMAMH